MSQDHWNFLFIGISFAVYIYIAVRSRAGSTGEFYVAGRGVSPFANGMATAADWMSAATFISMAGAIAIEGYDGGRFLMGWTGGYVLLTILMVPFLRKFGKATVPDFVGDRFYSNVTRAVAIVCAIFICLTYIMGQMRGVGIVFSQLFGIKIWLGVIIGGGIVFFYAALGGMKGITYTQVAQYCVMAFSYTLPAILISMAVTGNLIPQLGLIGSTAGENPEPFLAKLNAINEELGFRHYTAGKLSTLNMFCITLALMAGTAGLPHVIVRFFTVKDVKAVRTSACWTLAFIGVIYLTAPAVGAFARVNLVEQLHGVPYANAPAWLSEFEATNQMTFQDKNGDGIIQYGADPDTNELSFGKDIMVMANPYMGGLPKWVIGFLMAGCIAAALSTAAGLLLVLSTSISHDLMKKIVKPDISDQEEMRWARIASLGALLIAIYFGVNPPSTFVAKTVAFAFGLAASSFFPTLLIGIFSKRIGTVAATAGMITGITFTFLYIVYFQFGFGFIPKGTADQYLFGITPEGIGTIGMVLNFAVTLGLGYFLPPPPKEVQDMVDQIHLPTGSGGAVDH
ncbi:MAG: sodium:solute symporter family protein [Verrucomicrobiota bacterium]